ncbi:MAG: ATP-binding protein [Nitrospiraceae bacterium]|nr:ATP-binding protein [Nitrospiraceae bacterium]
MNLDTNSALQNVLSKLDRLLDRYVDGDIKETDLTAHPAFQWDGRRKSLRPIARPVQIEPGDLLGIESQKQLVLGNTARFLKGGRANNVLLWGERGTGKSSLIKSLIAAFGGTDLRMVQVLKHDILTVQDLYDIVASRPALRFILFIDDLSFEESQTDYKELKTIMDGGLEQIPANLLFYATSNRKHLIPTRFSDQDSDELRPGDTVEEKVSLADRFGLRLGFYHIDEERYLEIVDLYAKRAGIKSDRTALQREAIRWALQAGGRNGRIAEQFIRSAAGETGGEQNP